METMAGKKGRNIDGGCLASRKRRKRKQDGTRRRGEKRKGKAGRLELKLGIARGENSNVEEGKILSDQGLNPFLPFPLRGQTESESEGGTPPPNPLHLPHAFSDSSIVPPPQPTDGINPSLIYPQPPIASPPAPLSPSTSPTTTAVPPSSGPQRSTGGRGTRVQQGPQRPNGGRGKQRSGRKASRPVEKFEKICGECGKPIRYRRGHYLEFKRHEYSCSGGRYPCGICSRKFTRTESLREHMKKIHTTNM